ncbi:major facilitator superfamily domain-containing protein [Calycina marina]|uniref:Major facilitator superfamily domain-containing protein n=1 Tax=Calycina marina TaxID=1763456 RepID=A0A9P7Z0R4_9HELO|nr:major facilitator superfamily domain-containing protein [Calycina marina]
MGKMGLRSHSNGSPVDINVPKKIRPYAPPNPLLSPVSDRSFRDGEAIEPKKPEVVTWMSLPRKDQLAILFLCRLVDFLQVASMQTYVFYQLKSFDLSLPDSKIASQAGILQGCFTGAQVLTAIVWGKAADASWCGRKMVLVIGLGGTAVSCLGYGFATTFLWAAFWRFVGGGINGTVGIIRTMIAEITKERKYQSRAFLLLPMSFNVAGILGPIMGGLLADPASTLPGIFGTDGCLAFGFIKSYPYALPALLNAFFLTITTCIVFFGLAETLKERKGKFDLGLHLTSRFMSRFRTSSDGYSQLQTWDMQDVQMESLVEPIRPLRPLGKLPFARIWTRNVLLTLVSGAFYDFQLGAFTSLWTLFLSTARSTAPITLPFVFTGGLGMPAKIVGIATSILGMLGVTLQIFLYPPTHARLGTLRSFRYFLVMFPIAYFFAPYLAVLPSSSAAPEPSSGGFVWIGIILVLLMQVMARTFTLPATIILLNNCSPHPSVLGTIHGLGQSVSAGFRTVGPVVGGWWYGAGLERGVIGLAWWCVAAVSAAGCIVAMGVYEGSGHEVFLPGEQGELDNDEDDYKAEGVSLLADEKNAFEMEIDRLRGSPGSSMRESEENR